MEAADVVLMDSDLLKIPWLLGISSFISNQIKTNIFISLVSKIIMGRSLIHSLAHSPTHSLTYSLSRSDWVQNGVATARYNV